MKIVAVAACVAGIAHTYLAREKMINAAEELGHDIKVETQGVIGKENELTEKEIKDADVVIFATDVSVSDKDRFKGKKVVEVPTNVVVKNSLKLIKQIENKLEG